VTSNIKLSEITPLFRVTFFEPATKPKEILENGLLKTRETLINRK